VKVTEHDMSQFRVYLGDFGLSEGTIDTYAHHIKRAFEEGGPVARLKGETAPKTKRVTRAAARHWASWKEDAKLRKAVDQIRLPSPRRQAAKVPLHRDLLFLVMDEIDSDKKLTPGLRAVLGLMAYRGLRDGDCLRMRRAEVAIALQHGTLAFEAKGRRRLEFAVIKTFRRWLELLAAEPKWTRVDDLIAPRSKSAKSRRATAARTVQRALKRIGARLSIDGLHPHQLRRTYCVEYLRAHQGDAEAVIKLTQHMSWANVATAMEYLDHLRGVELDSVAETMFDR
jgi:integrase